MVDSFPQADDPGKACKMLWDNFHLGQDLAAVPRLPNATCKTTTWLSAGLRGLETSNWPLLKILSSPSSVNERVAFGLLYLPAFL